MIELIEPTNGMVEPPTPMTGDEPTLLIDCGKAAVLLGLAPADKPITPRSGGTQVVRRLIRSGKLSATKVGVRWMTSRAWLDEYMAANSNRRNRAG